MDLGIAKLKMFCPGLVVFIFVTTPNTIICDFNYYVYRYGKLVRSVYTLNQCYKIKGLSLRNTAIWQLKYSRLLTLDFGSAVQILNECNLLINEHNSFQSVICFASLWFCFTTLELKL